MKGKAKTKDTKVDNNAFVTDNNINVELENFLNLNNFSRSAVANGKHCIFYFTP